MYQRNLINSSCKSLFVNNKKNNIINYQMISIHYVQHYFNLCQCSGYSTVQNGKMVVIKLDLINSHFKLEFVDSGLYFVLVENNFVYPLLQVGSGSDE